MSKNKTIALAIKTIARKTADVSCGSASMFGMYQPKEPKKLVEVKQSKKD